MDPITQLCHKLAAERAHQASQQRTPSDPAPPPPYPSTDMGNDSDEEDQDDEPQSPLKLHINAAHHIQGSNNLVPTSPTPLADATKFGAILLHAINNINNAAAASSDLKTRRSVKVDLTINCGITVVGDRNVIGNVGVKPKQLPVSEAGVGVKRKAEEESSDESEAKRIAVAGDDSD